MGNKIVVLTGAGISTSAGIPDFNTFGSGIFPKLASYGLPSLEAVLLLSQFMKRPEAFYLFYKESNFDSFNPTPTHYFIRLLAEKGLVPLHLTQNVDGLEFKAGIPKNLVFQAHGSTLESHCPICRKDVDHELMKSHINKGEIMHCKECQGPCKPKIIFFGEPLPEDFFKRAQEFKTADLILIIGTSLKVAPFEKILSITKPRTKRVLINREEVGSFDFKTGTRDLFLEGDCDDIVLRIAKKCGWDEELDKLTKNN